MGLTGSRDDSGSPLSGAREGYTSHGRNVRCAQGALKRKREKSVHTRASDTENINPSTASASHHNEEMDDDYLMPSVFTWNFGGKHVYITGAWDGWTEKTPMHKNGAEYTAVIYVPRGEYQFKYFVDDNWYVCTVHTTRYSVVYVCSIRNALTSYCGFVSV